MDKQLKQDSWVRGTAIGKGSYGTVSLAFKNAAAHNKGLLVFAVKSVDKSSCLPSQIEALENEIGILRSLSSPYVVDYMGDDETVESSPSNMMTSSFRNLHMEYLPGGTVADVARARRPSTFGAEEERIVRNYAFCVASGLKYLHSQGIVHCDVKGDNVLAGPTSGTAKLADFGSANMEITRPRGCDKIFPRGSPLWMAPEVVRGEYQGPESDVWSLGCTVIEMVTGKPAWEDRGAAETIRRIGYSDELPRFPAQLSEVGRDFVEKCLRREIKQRWSCDQLLQHPFISKCTPPAFATYASPRCVLDCFNSDSDEEEEEISTTSDRGCDSEVRGRIGRLSSGEGAVWESDGWTAVRGLVSVTEATLWVSSDDDGDGDQGEGTSWGYWGIGGAEWEDDDSLGIGGIPSEEYLVDSFSCSAVVEAVRNDPHHHESRHDGAVTECDYPAGWVESQAEQSHSRCRRIHYLWILYWLLIFHHANSNCWQLLLYSIAHEKIFGFHWYTYPSPCYIIIFQFPPLN